jgi:serine/threonine protein phosphatase PrpC
MDTCLQPSICSASVRGHSHVLRDIPNQDSSCYKFSSSNELWAAAIADGHGSSAHPRSDVGSRIAVQCAVDVLLGYLESKKADSIDLEELRVQLAEHIIQAWRVDISKYHLDKNEGFDSGSSIQELSDREFILYGTTLAFAAPYRDSILLGSIGDSDGFWRSKSGLVRSLNLFGNTGDGIGEETHSLCLPNAKKFFSLAALQVGANGGTLVLATDGVKKSLRHDVDLNNLLDYYHDLAATDLEAVEDDLRAQLEELTTDGSGDDCTAVVIHFPCETKRAKDIAEEARNKGVELGSISESNNSELVELEVEDDGDRDELLKTASLKKKTTSSGNLLQLLLLAAGLLLLAMAMAALIKQPVFPSKFLTQDWLGMKTRLLSKANQIVNKADCLRP